jgi:hypothetical protein
MSRSRDLQAQDAGLFTLPLRATRSAVYDQIEDAEGRLVAFIGGTDNDKSQKWCAAIVNAVNSYYRKKCPNSSN